jgi:predicted PurR-regulated permease PerM
MKIKSLHIKNKIEICSIIVITSLFAAALISNLGFSSTDVLAQGSQNATQPQPQQQQDTTLAPVLNFTQNLRTLAQELGVSTTSSLEEIPNAVQQFANNTNFQEFSQRLSQFAQQSGLNTTRLEQASPDGNITGRLQNFTESIERDITR